MADYTTITCFSCNKQMAPIIYGYPTPEMIDLARQDIIALGGPLESADRPTHYCYSCDETN